MQINVFIPCLMNQFFPQIAHQFIHLLEEVDCQIAQVGPNLCCAFPEFQTRPREEAKKKALVFLDKVIFDTKYFVVPSASCVAMLRHQLEGLLGKELPPNYYQWQQNIVTLSEFLTEIIPGASLPKAHLEGRAFFQESCQAKRICGISEAPRILLAAVEGLQLIEHPQSAVCCGFESYSNWDFSKIGYQLAEDKIDLLTSLSIEYIITAEISCYLHLKHYLESNRKPLKVLHLIDVLSRNS